MRQPTPPAATERPASATPRRTDATALVGYVGRGDGTGQRVWRAVAQMMSSTHPSRELAELAAGSQLPVSTGRRIAVTSVRGGAGKSAIAAVLASVYAARRADPVLAADADPDGGSLAWRLGKQDVGTLAELAPRLLAARGGDLTGLEPLLPRTSTGLWVLPGGAPGQPHLARDVTRALSRLFAVCVTDCGRGMDSPATVEVLSEAHAVVVVTPATADGVRSTCDALDRVAGADRAASLSRVVVALNTISRDGRSALNARAVRDALGRFDVPVVTVPHDRHLAAAAPIGTDRLGEATIVEATRLAGHLLARAKQL